MSPNEAQDIYERLKGLQTWRASVVDNEDTKKGVYAMRTSQSVPFRRRPVPQYMRQVYQRFCHVFRPFLLKRLVELEIQAVYYLPGQEIKAHHDSATIYEGNSYWTQNDYRLVTGLLFLNSTKEGSGSTILSYLFSHLRASWLCSLTLADRGGLWTQLCMHSGALVTEDDERWLLIYGSAASTESCLDCSSQISWTSCGFEELLEGPHITSAADCHGVEGAPFQFLKEPMLGL